MSRPEGCGCEPEEIFELADRALTPERERDVRLHLEQCPGCYEAYQRETRMNYCLKSMSFSESNSVCGQVAMALPTRPLKARLVWAFLAVTLLSTALFALWVTGINPAVFVVDSMSMFWGTASMLADVLDIVLAIAGGALFVALAVGALVDLLLAAVLLKVSRHRTRQV